MPILSYSTDWAFIENGVVYLEWRNAYRKLLEYLAQMRNFTRIHSSSDQQCVRILKDCSKRCQMWLDEMRNPIPYSGALQNERRL